MLYGVQMLSFIWKKNILKKDWLKLNFMIKKIWSMNYPDLKSKNLAITWIIDNCKWYINYLFITPELFIIVDY